MLNNNNLILKKGASIKEALEIIEKGSLKIGFILNDDSSIFGSISDGDIRRWIISNGSISGSAEEICNKSPIKLRKGYNLKDVKKIMNENSIFVIPIVDEKNKLLDFLTHKDIYGENLKKVYNKIEAPVIIMAGGKGTRLKPFTNILPKALIPFGEKPIIEIIMDRFSKYGCTDFRISVNSKARIIKAYFEEYETNLILQYINEDKPLGTAGALQFLKNKIEVPFFVSNCDILVDADYSDIYEFHKNGNYDITLISAIRQYNIPYGVCELNKNGDFIRINEKPGLDFLVNTGLYILNADVIDQIPSDTFFHITHLIEKIKSRGGNIGVYAIGEDSWKDIGQWKEYNSSLEKFS
jgi:dTDP-glucose pyrophosphorylase